LKENKSKEIALVMASERAKANAGMWFSQTCLKTAWKELRLAKVLVLD